MRPTVRLLGTRGVPANYGGFETAAENIASYLVARGWRVIAYCQSDVAGQYLEDEWEGIERVTFGVTEPGWLGTAHFDLLSAWHARRFDDPCVVFGYNTAGFNVLQRLRGAPLIFNMDGIEWSRVRWGLFKRSMFYLNEWVASWIGTSLIADHPEIRRHLETRCPADRVTMIPYGAHDATLAPAGPVAELGLTPGRYATLVCRAIPENSILELVTGFSAKRRGIDLAVVADYDPAGDPYHAAVVAAASPEVKFVGAIYDDDRLAAVRAHGLLYLHGHTAGGTNPSLVEAMGAANPVLAHDNSFNRWVVGDGAAYFRDADEAGRRLDELLADPERLRCMAAASHRRWRELFTWDRVSAQYEALLWSALDTPPGRPARRAAGVGGSRA